MVNYAEAKIYRIIDNSTGLQYVGSTCQSLAKRLHGHRGQYQGWMKKGCLRGNNSRYVTSIEVLKGGNATIELLEKCENITCKDELNAREGHFIRELDCVNKVVPGRTMKERYETDPEYREHRINMEKERYRANRDKILARIKERWTNNPEEERKKRMDWRGERIRCETCGSTITRGSYATHKRTKYCLEAAAAKAEQGL
jgi:hypothetical protein